MKQYEHPELDSVDIANVLQALADPCRLQIVRHLLESPEQEFACNEFPIEGAKATRSHHFQILRGAGIIRTRVDGTKCMTSLRREELDQRFPGLVAFLTQSAASPASV
ncbi:DNA-binding transcriptional regulator, ArsR family [Terrimicrobium sacchariphilum]|uniref:DNA-binding transcriptional regulator, ArsR family n=1 Tax=Terrimicrobium sacchariphilum TaxID=690879 RepID=A0A146GB19_TERSA|nr:helix-turn-helix transcriptional regulator [Terrimicrobium sacchariphilum]GAT33987.1 DNA-binding transcriptional regulator, ArsR family [Terrimicrobium sacchariphilum]